eukprot:3857716-Pleurochrysis_carterae.AAC.2
MSEKLFFAEMLLSYSRIGAAVTSDNEQRNDLGPGNIAVLSEALRVNTTLTTLDLMGAHSSVPPPLKVM